MVQRDEVTAAQGVRIEGLLLGQPDAPGRSGVATRLCGNAVLWVLRSGAPWPARPPRSGPWQSVPQRVPRGVQAGGGARGFATRTPERDKDSLMRARPLVCAPQPAATGNGGGPGPGAGACQRRPDARTPPCRRHARAPAPAGAAPRARAVRAGGRPRPGRAPAAYDAPALRTRLAASGAEAGLPCHPPRKRILGSDAAISKPRNHLERSFNTLNPCRRLAPRDDRKALYFLAFLHLAAALGWMR